MNPRKLCLSSGLNNDYGRHRISQAEDSVMVSGSAVADMIPNTSKRQITARLPLDYFEVEDTRNLISFAKLSLSPYRRQLGRRSGDMVEGSAVTISFLETRIGDIHTSLV